MEWSRKKSVYHFFWGVGGLTSLKWVSASVGMSGIFSKCDELIFKISEFQKRQYSTYWNFFLSSILSNTGLSSHRWEVWCQAFYHADRERCGVMCLLWKCESHSPTIIRCAVFLNGSVPLSTFGCISPCILLPFLMMHLFVFYSIWQANGRVLCWYTQEIKLIKFVFLYMKPCWGSPGWLWPTDGCTNNSVALPQPRTKNFQSFSGVWYIVAWGITIVRATPSHVFQSGWPHATSRRIPWRLLGHQMTKWGSWPSLSVKYELQHM